MTLIRTRNVAGAGVTLSLLAAGVAFAAPDRTFAPSPSAPVLEWDSEPMTGTILGVDTDRDDTLVKLPAGGNVAIKLTNFEDVGGEPDFDIRLYVADAAGDPEGEALGEAITADTEQESLTVKNLKPGDYVVEVNPFLTVEGTFHGAITVTGATVTAAAPADGGSPTAPAAPGSGGGEQAPRAADQTPDAKIGRIARKPRSFKGTASDDNGVQKVEIALERKAGKKCKQMTAKGKFVKQDKCGAPTSWLTAKGTTKWSYKLKKKLKKGRYTLLARATDSAGQSQAGFTRANKKSFKVK